MVGSIDEGNDYPGIRRAARGMYLLGSGSKPSPVGSTPVPTSITGDSTPGREEASVLVRAPESFLEACRETARTVGYPVPCPSKILAGGTPPPEVTSCRIGLIGAGRPRWMRTRMAGLGSRFHADQSAPSRASGFARTGPLTLEDDQRPWLVPRSKRGSPRDRSRGQMDDARGLCRSGHERGQHLLWSPRSRVDHRRTHLRTRIPLGWLAPRDSDTQRDRRPIRVLGGPLASRRAVSCRRLVIATRRYASSES